MTNPRQALEEAWNAIHDYQKAPWQPLAVGNGMERFRRFLDAEAWTDAALMLVPEGWTWDVSTRPDGSGGVVYLHSPDRTKWRDRGGFAETPALALAQACLKARENGDG